MRSVFRIVAGLMFMWAGTMILFNYPPNPMPGMPRLVLMSQVGVGGVLEAAGGLAIMLGLFTRPVAFLLSGEMAVAYFQFHAPHGFYPNVNGGIPAVLYSFFFLYLVFAGPGPWSVDGILGRRKLATS
jgi:putative oxidoreductase